MSSKPTSLDLERAASGAAQGLPALLAEASSLAQSVAAGAHGRRRAGTGESFWQYRDYTFGDPATAIDWRQSARSPARLYVRETEWETAATIRLWVDGGEGFDYSSGEAPTKRWRAQVLGTAVALLLTQAGEKVAPLVEGPSRPARTGRAGLVGLAETFLRTEDRSAIPPWAVAGTTQAIYISDFYTDADGLLAQLGRMAAQGVPVHLVQVSDSAERLFPFAGRVRFEAPDDPNSHVQFGDADHVAAAYRERRDAHLGALKDVCRRYGFTYLAHETSEPASVPLAALYHAVGGGTR